MPESGEMLKSTEVLAKLAEVLATWPLYRPFTYITQAECESPPNRLDLFCKTCRKEQKWELDRRQYQTYTGFDSAKYVCRNCGKAEARYYWLWSAKTAAESTFIKIGQFPPLEEKIGPELERRFQEADLEFYRKALRCRNFNLGIAALTYLRRVVENRMNDLLDMIAEIAQEYEFEAALLDHLAEVKSSRVFDEKVTYAAKILPANLRPGGTNPVDLLHDLASEGIHRKAEDECIDIFDTSRVVFEYLFRELEVRKAEADKFVSGIRALAARKASRKKANSEE